MLVKQQKWPDTVSMCLRFGEACDKVNARSSQAKAYLGAMVVWLYAQDPKEAWQVGGLGFSGRHVRVGFSGRQVGLGFSGQVQGGEARIAMGCVVMAARR